MNILKMALPLFVLLVGLAVLTSAQTVASGANAVLPKSGSTLTGAPTVINRDIKVEQEVGSTADVQLNTCISTLSGLGGGICDARGFGYTTQTIVATVTTASNVFIQMNPATTFHPATASVDMFSIAENSGISGLTVNALNVTNYAGTVVKFVGNCLHSDRCYLRDFNLTNGTNDRNPQTGTAILLSAAAGVNGLSFVNIEHGKITGFLNGMYLTSTGSIGSGNFVNDTHTSDVVITNAVHCITLYSNPGDVQGSTFDQATCEAGGGNIANATGYVVKGQKGSKNKANLFVNGNIWDYGVGATQTSYSFDSNSSVNWLQANIAFGIRDDSTDAGTNNQVWNLGFALTIKQVGIRQLEIIPATGYTKYWLTTNGIGNEACLSDGRSPGAHYDWCSDYSGNLSPTGHLNQSIARNFAGTCIMSGTSCTFTLNAPFTSTPICIATEQSTGEPLAASCSVSGTKATITAARANSSVWAALVIGNPN